MAVLATDEERSWRFPGVPDIGGNLWIARECATGPIADRGDRRPGVHLNPPRWFLHRCSKGKTDAKPITPHGQDEISEKVEGLQEG